MEKINWDWCKEPEKIITYKKRTIHLLHGLDKIYIKVLQQKIGCSDLQISINEENVLEDDQYLLNMIDQSISLVENMEFLYEKLREYQQNENYFCFQTDITFTHRGGGGHHIERGTRFLEGQRIREGCAWIVCEKKTKKIVFAFDDKGNILSAKEFAEDFVW